MTMIKRIAFLFACLLVGAPAWAATYYVSKTGLDAHACSTTDSAATNRLTINAGIACLAAGDILIIHVGTYVEYFGQVVQPPSGSAGSPTTIRSASGELVTVRPNTGNGNNLQLGHSYITFDGITFDNTDVTPLTMGWTTNPSSDVWKLEGPNDPTDSHDIIITNSILKSGALGILGQCRNCTFSNNEFFGQVDNLDCATGGACSTGHGGYAVYSCTQNSTFDNNYLHGQTNQGFNQYSQVVNCQGNTYKNNRIENISAGDGIYICCGGGSTTLVFNNVISNVANGVHLVNMTATVLNNTIYSASNSGVQIDCCGSTFRNNIILNGTPFQDFAGGSTFSNNLCGSLVTGCALTGTAAATFVNPGTDFNLRNGSIAIDNGATIGSITTDIVGTPRPTGIAYDIGAYEYTDTLPLVFNYFSPYVIDHTKVPSNQTRFPVWISLTDARFKTVANGGHVQHGLGYDVRMASNSNCASANLIPYQLMNYTASTGAIQLRVVTNLSSSMDTTVYFCYGNSVLNADGSSTAVWDSDYLAVWPLGQLGSLSLTDFSGNNVNGTGVNSPTALAGQVDGGVTLSAVGRQYIDAGSAIAPTAITIEAWVNPTSFPHSYNSIVSRVATNFSSFADITVKDTGKIAFYTQTTGGTPNYDGTGSHTLLVANWYHVVATYDSTSGLIGYVNAASDGTAAANGALLTATAPTHIGDDPPFNSVSDNRNWNGLIDEVKISRIARSADWITTTYNNEGPNANTFAALGTENNVTPPSGPVSVFAPKIFSPGIFHSAIFH